MTRGVYTAAAGMLANQAAQDVIAQNLANAGTTGYKQDLPQFQSFEQTLLQRQTSGAGPAIGGLGRGAQLEATVTDFSGGSLEKTGNPLDVALTGDAYLAVQTPSGVRLTRDGSLTRSTQGQLVQANGGAPVLSQDGQPINLPADAKNIVITPRGQIKADDAVVGTLRLVGVARTDNATKIGSNLFSEQTLRPASPDAQVRQGYLEMSNVSVVKEMVSMITLQRAYETNSKMLQAEDDATGKAVNDVGKV